MGLPQGPVRPPLVPLSGDEERALARDLTELGLV
jgi:dihydrodipicolinate synthase/N-acetylneuraminate lyase